MASGSNYMARRFLAFLLVVGVAGGIGFCWRTRSTTGLSFIKRQGATVAPASITLLTSGSKQKLFEQLIEAFQGQQPGATVTIKVMESREALQYLLHQASAEERPDLYSPSDPRLATSLDNNWRKSHGGRALIATSSADEDFIFAETPIVFLTTAEKAAELSGLFTGEHPWNQIRTRVTQGDVMSWGRLRYSVANPVGSASGLTTLGMMAADSSSANTPLPPFLKEISKGLLYDDAAQRGSSALFEAYLSELISQGGSPRDFIVTYESNVLRAAHEHPELQVRLFYPAQTPFAMHRICLLESAGADMARRKVAAAFLKFLKTPEAQRIVMDNYLHPRFVPDTVMDSVKDSAGVGFRTTKARAPLTSYNTSMNVLQLWNEKVAPTLIK